MVTSLLFRWRTSLPILNTWIKMIVWLDDHWQIASGNGQTLSKALYLPYSTNMCITFLALISVSVNKWQFACASLLVFCLFACKCCSAMTSHDCHKSHLCLTCWKFCFQLWRHLQLILVLAGTSLCFWFCSVPHLASYRPTERVSEAGCRACPILLTQNVCFLDFWASTLSENPTYST